MAAGGEGCARGVRGVSYRGGGVLSRLENERGVVLRVSRVSPARCGLEISQVTRSREGRVLGVWVVVKPGPEACRDAGGGVDGPRA